MRHLPVLVALEACGEEGQGRRHRRRRACVPRRRRKECVSGRGSSNADASSEAGHASRKWRLRTRRLAQVGRLARARAFPLGRA
eukprot:6054233-Prymnesium_polylepis.1